MNAVVVYESVCGNTRAIRKQAVQAAQEDAGTHVEAEAAEEPGLRSWLRDLRSAQGNRAAAFDTRLDNAPWFTGLASRGIAKRLPRHGYEIVDSDSFLVQEAEGPLEAGELDRARAWGKKLGGAVETSP